MSSQSKRRAELEEVAHKKKPRKGGDEDDFNQDNDDGPDVEDGEVGALDTKDNLIPTDRRTRGKRVDYTKVRLGDFETGEDVSKENKGAPAGPRTRSPQVKPAANIEENDEEDDDDDEEEEEYDENEDGTDEYYEEDEEEGQLA